MPANNTWDYWKQFLNGRNPYGRAGLVNTSTPGYFQIQPQSEGGDSYVSTNPRVQGNGTGAVIDGNWVQVGDNQGHGWDFSSKTGGFKDLSKLKWDDEFGLLSPYDNMVQDNSFMGNYLPWAIAAIGAGGIAAEGAGLLGSGGGLSSAEGLAGIDALESGGTLGLNAAGTGTVPYVGTGAAGAVPEFAETIGVNGGSGNGLLGSLQQGGSGLLDWALKNPMQAYGLLNMASGLFGNKSNGASGNSGGGDSSGGGLLAPKAMNIPKQQFYTNPYTQSQLQNFQFATPRR